jgi:hypothetical protein
VTGKGEEESETSAFASVHVKCADHLTLPWLTLQRVRVVVEFRGGLLMLEGIAHYVKPAVVRVAVVMGQWR